MMDQAREAFGGTRGECPVMHLGAVPVGLSVDEHAKALVEVGAGVGRQFPHRLIPQEGLGELLSDGLRSAGDGHLGPGQPTGVGKRGHHQHPASATRARTSVSTPLSRAPWKDRTR